MKKIKGVESVYIFGSYAKDKLSLESDIDLLIVGNFDTLKLQKVLLEIQKFTGREINSVE
ncbi:nucleotidyltransferase domain-containing protein, partial [bacterium]|nr:nucleotidyltransferase domain-containing protein [bacterium]